MMPLTFADKGKPYQIIKITGKDEIRAHLHNLGFVENETVCVLQDSNGNLIVQVKDGRVAMDASLARRIMI